MHKFISIKTRLQCARSKFIVAGRHHHAQQSAHPELVGYRPARRRSPQPPVATLRGRNDGCGRIPGRAVSHREAGV